MGTVNFTMLVRNRPRLTAQALDSLGDMGSATITILDDRSDDETRLMLELWCEDNAAHLVRNDNPIGTGQLRNLVISESEKHYGKGELLYISDNDVKMLQPDWLDVLSTAYKEAWEHRFRLLGAYGHPFNRPCAPGIRLASRWAVDEVFALASQSMLASWSTWEAFGPFCDTPIDRVCQSEDVDMSNRIRYVGMKVGVISPPLLANTGLSNSFGEHIPGWELVKSQCPDGVICE